jgi:hypothetical protein
MYDLSENFPDYDSLLPLNLFENKDKNEENKEDCDFSDNELTNCSKVFIFNYVFRLYLNFQI